MKLRNNYEIQGPLHEAWTPSASEKEDEQEEQAANSSSAWKRREFSISGQIDRYFLWCFGKKGQIDLSEKVKTDRHLHLANSANSAVSCGVGGCRRSQSKKHKQKRIV